MKSRFELKSTQFRQERQDSWRELEKLLKRVERRRLSALSPAEINRLPVLYQGVLSSLSVARAISLDRNLLLYLEALAEEAYGVVYANRKPFLRVLADFFGNRFPVALWRARGALLLSFLALLFGGGVAFLETARDMERYYTFVPAPMAAGRDPQTSTEDLRSTLYQAPDAQEDDDSLVAFSSFLFSHNARIGMLCFAVGCVPFVPTFYLLFYNGSLLGAFVALFHARGLGLDVWGWLLPHGVTEFLAILVCAAAGLRTGMGVLFPGRLTRIESIKRRGREAGALVAGAVAMFFVAGLIEGIFRQRVQSIEIRYAVVAASVLFYGFYIGWLGRRLSR